MSTTSSAIESNSDAVVSSEPVSNGVAASNEVIVDGTKTLIMESSSDRKGGGATAVQDPVDDVSVSGDEIGIVIDAKFMDELSSDALLSSVPPTNCELAVSNGDKVGVGLLESQSGTQTIDPCSNRDGGGEILVHQDPIDDAKVSGDEVGNVVENGDNVMDESSSDAVVISVHVSNSDIAASNGVKIEASLLESKTGSLTMESSCNHDGSGDVAVQDSIDEARAFRETVVEDVMNESSSYAVGSPLVNSETAASNEVRVGPGLLESKSGALTMEPSSNHDGGGDIVDHQDSVDDSRVSGDEKATLVDDDEKALDGSSSDAVVLSAPPSNSEVTAINRVSIGAGLLEWESGTQTMESSSNHGGGGDNVDHHDSVDDTRISADERLTVKEDVMKVLEESSSDPVAFSVPKSTSDIAARNGVEAMAGLLESKTGILMMEQSSNHDGGGDNVDHHDSVDDTRISADEKGTVSEDVVKVLEESTSDPVALSVPTSTTDIAARNGFDTMAGLLESKTGTLTMEQPSNHYGGGDIVLQDSMDDSRVLENEKGIVIESVDKVLDENGVTAKEKDGKYKVTDLVWAKVRCYPWWPGQIFDPSASTDKAKKYSNKKGFLVGYFGDQTFAWNKPSKIKPFRKNFSKLEKQSTSKAFFHAVNCALDEVSRRAEFGLACSCLSDEAYGKIKSQTLVNAGIREDASKIDGGDRFSTVATFKPANIVHSVQDLAREHFDGFDRLEVFSLRAQLLAYNRWKGYNQFQAQNLVKESNNKLEDNSELPLMEEDKVVEDAKPSSVDEKISSKKRRLDASDSGSRKHTRVHNDDKVDEDAKPASEDVKVSSKRKKLDASDSCSRKHKPLHNDDKTVDDAKPASVDEKVSSKKRKLYASDSGSRKHKRVHNDDSVSNKKEKRVTYVSPKGSLSVTRKQIGGKKGERNGIKEENRKGTADQKSSISSPKKLFRVGDTICRIAKQISESPSILKKEPEKSKKDEKCVEQTKENKNEPIVYSSRKSKKSKEKSATALILKFKNLDSIPSVTNLNEIFSRYGPIRETETEVLKKNNCAKVVFNEKSNAETAFSSAGKFSIFGPSLISYRLDYSPTLGKTSKKDEKSVDACQTEE